MPDPLPDANNATSTGFLGHAAAFYADAASATGNALRNFQ
jgi:hypothetical protein